MSTFCPNKCSSHKIRAFGSELLLVSVSASTKIKTKKKKKKTHQTTQKKPPNKVWMLSGPGVFFYFILFIILYILFLP